MTTRKKNHSFKLKGGYLRIYRFNTSYELPKQSKDDGHRPCSSGFKYSSFRQ